MNKTGLHFEMHSLDHSHSQSVLHASHTGGSYHTSGSIVPHFPTIHPDHHVGNHAHTHTVPHSGSHPGEIVIIDSSYSVTVPLPFSSYTATGTTSGMKTQEVCIGIPHVLQHCSAQTTHPGHQTVWTDCTHTLVGSWCDTFIVSK